MEASKKALTIIAIFAFILYEEAYKSMSVVKIKVTSFAAFCVAITLLVWTYQSNDSENPLIFHCAVISAEEEAVDSRSRSSQDKLWASCLPELILKLTNKGSTQELFGDNKARD